ncbi:hypothetical protein F1B92_01665 [Campylobacter sp. FMV-PI01]|uniref:Uncharacterized protein n=1 Tax=Campylobacter portucalensis TaxID=2608384 RepID=A0A6L5WJJ8_9BACT|nr:hypothetical protein [Campylobacter portucalensis]MSN95911.1 hypothetical protein [Campylobacter portucalensis]
MKNTQFYTKISQNLNSQNLNTTIFNEVYEVGILNLRDKSLSEKKHILNSLFNDICDDLMELEILNKSTLRISLEALRKALTKDEEDYLYKLMFESEKIKKAVYLQGKEIKNMLYDSFKNVENSVKFGNSKHKDAILSVINEEMINLLELKDLIKEISQNVFLTIIESKEDIEETSREFSKNLVYKSIGEDEFKKQRVFEISKLVINEAIGVANLGQIYVKELLSGVISGVNDGIELSVNKAKMNLEFVPDELKTDGFRSEFEGLEDEFITILKNLIQNSENPSKEILESILKKDYDNYITKMKRISSEAVKNLKYKLESIEVGENYKEFSKNLIAKFDDLKRDFSKKSTKIANDFELNEKFASLKKEIEDIEKKIISKFKTKKDEDINEYSKRAYDATKNKMKDKNSDDKLS